MHLLHEKSYVKNSYCIDVMHTHSYHIHMYMHRHTSHTVLLLYLPPGDVKFWLFPHPSILRNDTRRCLWVIINGVEGDFRIKKLIFIRLSDTYAYSYTYIYGGRVA